RRHTRFSRDWSSDVCSSDLFRAARRQVADSDYQHMQAQQNAAALELLARVTRQFILTLAAQEQLSLLQGAATLAQKNEALISERSEERRVGKECRARRTTYH